MPQLSLQQVDRTCVLYRKRKLVYFGGCDYFRLSSHPEVMKALRSGLKRFGLNVAASRRTTGNHALYQTLEESLARFFGAPKAVLLASGYVTNLVVAQTLARNFSHVLIDGRAHHSLLDAAHFFDAPVLKFEHRDSEDLARTVHRCGQGSRLILLTDGLFAHNGSAAPLGDYLRIIPQDAWILVDDAHGAGVLGETGQGTLEEARVRRNRIIQTISLSKAFGTYGGAILCDAQLSQVIQQKSRLFQGNTPLPLPLANAALKAVEILKTDRSLRTRLTRNSCYVKTKTREAGFSLPLHSSPIIPLIPADQLEVKKMRRSLLARQIYPPFIDYPAGTMKAYFRFVISSEHTREQLNSLIDVLSAIGSGATVG